MLSNTQIKQLIIDNLNSPFCFPMALFLTKLIQRDTTKFNTPDLYRIKDVNTNTDVTSLSDFISKIDDTKFEYNVNISSYSNNMIGVIVKMMNFEVTLKETHVQDSPFTSIFGIGKHRVCFHLAYARDNDATLPMKISNIVLLSTENE